jgi:hypothetical protein
MQHPAIVMQRRAAATQTLQPFPAACNGHAVLCNHPPRPATAMQRPATVMQRLAATMQRPGANPSSLPGLLINDSAFPILKILFILSNKSPI